MKRAFRLAGPPLFALLLCSCARFPLQPQSRFQGRLEAEQLVRFHFRGKEFSLHQQLEIDGTRTRLVALTPMGLRAFLLEYDAKGLHFENNLPELLKIEPERIMADLQKLYWPAGPLEGKGAWSITFATDQEGMRLIREKNRLDSRISALPGGHKGDLLLENIRLGYQIEIQNLGDE